ncbi:hypothetical protein MLD38_003384 [Melastoma candidum]|uniref:Uncharacterized protein n=1 Tax=Melastoma candidum TaxID=119954 RepID=A0ACB9S2M9_9MYRT|nr:hypothetical protein MLD38_003384 [Melastoma candidum]
MSWEDLAATACFLPGGESRSGVGIVPMDGFVLDRLIGSDGMGLDWVGGVSNEKKKKGGEGGKWWNVLIGGADSVLFL